jgi:hypothetical protein
MPFVEPACWDRRSRCRRSWLAEAAVQADSKFQDPAINSRRECIVSTQAVNRLSGLALILLSLTALFVVLWGYTQPPLPDEGIGAHTFQLSIVALVPVTLVFLATADWSRPSRSVRPLAIAVAATVLAFAALYYLEHVYYPGQL